MFSLIRKKQAQPARPDPAPSRWSWRMQRLMLTPTFRFGLRFGLPLGAIVAGVAVYLSDDARRDAIWQGVADIRASIEERPEFMVHMMAIDGVDDQLATEIRSVVPLEFPLSSFDLDLGQVRKNVSDLSGVKNAVVRIRPGGVLQVNVTPRLPVALWRGDDGLYLVDVEGVLVAQATARSAHKDLPLFAGRGASRHVIEALQLVKTAMPIKDRMRGIVRMGERRWDVVLDRDQRILLPEYGAVQALERVIALQNAQDMLSRDVARIDMRLAERPTVKMNEDATREWWRIRQISGQ